MTLNRSEPPRIDPTLYPKDAGGNPATDFVRPSSARHARSLWFSPKLSDRGCRDQKDYLFETGFSSEAKTRNKLQYNAINPKSRYVLNKSP
jgi:hypothetical protein